MRKISLVVYLLYPTSNHNYFVNWKNKRRLYIFYILHQTTTLKTLTLLLVRCISFISYIKPQLRLARWLHLSRCISFISYIKPQLHTVCCGTTNVVYLLYPTSNHNPHRYLAKLRNVVYLLYPTSNHNCGWFAVSDVTLYIFYILHQTTTQMLHFNEESRLYIFYILHQTTTLWLKWAIYMRCISFISYIKPQRFRLWLYNVYRCISFISYIKPQLSA